jgi:hypothetical protein
LGFAAPEPRAGFSNNLQEVTRKIHAWAREPSSKVLQRKTAQKSRDLSEESKRTGDVTSKVKEAPAVQLASRTTFPTSLLTEEVAVLLYGSQPSIFGINPPPQLIDG